MCYKFQFVEQIKTAPTTGAVLSFPDIQEIKPKCFSASMMAASFSSGAGMAVIIVFMLTDAQLFTNLSNVCRVNLDPRYAT